VSVRECRFSVALDPPELQGVGEPQGIVLCAAAELFVRLEDRPPFGVLRLATCTYAALRQAGSNGDQMDSALLGPFVGRCGAVRPRWIGGASWWHDSSPDCACLAKRRGTLPGAPMLFR
jgi:hypothetical protein